MRGIPSSTYYYWYARWSDVRGPPRHPQTQGKIERWHQTIKNRVLLENRFLPGDLKQQSSRLAPSSITTTTTAITRA